MIVVAAAVVVIGVVALLIGGAVLAGERRSLAGPGLAVLAGAGAVVVLLVVAVLGLGIARPATAPPSEPIDVDTPTTARAAAPASTLAAAPVTRPRLTVAGSDAPLVRVSAYLGDLSDGDVIEVVATGFPANVTGELAQCGSVGVRPEACANAFPVRFDDAGQARVQFAVDAGVAACGPGSPCAVIVRAEDRQAFGRLFFGRPAPATTTFTVTPSDHLRPGDAVQIAIDKAPPGETLSVLLCNDGASFPAGCTTLGPVSQSATTLSVPAESRCGARQPCLFALVDSRDTLVADAVRARFAAGPFPRYEATRVLLGLAAAASALAIAVWLLRSTDWTEPSEASVA